MFNKPYAWALLATSATFAGLQAWYPFPDPRYNPLLLLIVEAKPMIYATLKLAWATVLFLLPSYIWFGLARKFARKSDKAANSTTVGVLPAYPDPASRRELFAIVGELHHPDKMEPSLTPQWCEIPEAGLSRGVMVLGAPGTGKTSSVLLPIADQVLGYMAHDRSRRCGGLVLEVKADFGQQIKRVLAGHGRSGDFMEISPRSPYCYNPLYNGASASALAYRLVSVLRVIRGHTGTGDSSHFWDEASQGFATFLISIHRLLYDYVTFRDLYIASSSPDVVKGMMEKAERTLDQQYILVSKSDYLKLSTKAAKQLDLFDPDASGEQLRLEISDALVKTLDDNSIPYSRSGVEDRSERHEAFESAQVYYKKLKALSPEMQTNIAVTLNTALQPFDMDLEARRIFCPPKAAYDPVLNRDGRHGRPLPSFEQLIETPTVLALALPTATDEGLARIAGVMMKQDWQRAVLMRRGTPGWDARLARKLLLLIDEYHLLATAGGAQPDGDEKFLNLCRDSGCLPVVAMQSLSSLWETVGNGGERVITQGLQTTICMRQKNPDTAEWMSRMCGRKEVLKEHFGLSEGTSDIAGASLGGGIVGQRASMNASRSWAENKDSIFESKLVHELPDGAALACVYNGFAQLPPTLLFLQPHGSDHRQSWWTTHKDKLNHARKDK